MLREQTFTVNSKKKKKKKEHGKLMSSWSKVDQTKGLQYENYLLKIPKAHNIFSKC